MRRRPARRRRPSVVPVCRLDLPSLRQLSQRRCASTVRQSYVVQQRRGGTQPSAPSFRPSSVRRRRRPSAIVIFTAKGNGIGLSQIKTNAYDVTFTER